MKPIPKKIFIFIMVPVFLVVFVLDQECSFEFFSFTPLIYFLLLIFWLIHFLLVLFQKDKNRVNNILQSVCLLAVFILSFFFSILYRSQCIKNTETRGEVIAAGLKKFYMDHKAYPGNLNELVPEYLNKIPSTSMGIRTHEFSYIIEDEGQKYILSYNLNLGLTGFYSGEKWTYSD